MVILMLAVPAMLDLQRAAVVVPAGLAGPQRQAVRLLVEEVEKRAAIRWPVRERGEAGAPVIALSVQAREPAEGYRIDSGSRVTVIGNDSRGLLFGVGRLLRELRMRRGSVTLPAGLSISSVPRLPVRGHQLGYRPVNNTYDTWNVAMYEQYLRDLAVFGSNTIEMVMPGEPDGSPHYTLPPLRMTGEVSRLCAAYGLDVSLWCPAPEKDYSDPTTVERSLARCRRVFAALPRLDAVFVPGGDPGHTRPRVLMPYLEKLAAELRRRHPRGQIWVSPQGMDDEWLAEFYGILQTGPAWLTGVVHGPWVRVDMRELRSAVPSRYPIRLYPDISHTVRCQFPVPDWDRAYALTYIREPVNPRPMALARIFAEYHPGSIGFVTYSDGAHDDVNKMVWSALGWDPRAEVSGILREYARYFIGEERFGEGLLALERNWQGPLAANTGVEATLARFVEMETPPRLRNWRFQQALYRAATDAYTRSRSLDESAREERALASLRDVESAGSLAAMEAAGRALEPEPVAPELRTRIFALAEALFQSVGMQLSVARYAGAGWERGVTLDTLDAPLNDRKWLLARFAEIRGLPDEATRRARLRELAGRTDPGPGGFYDDLGNPSRQPRLVPFADGFSLQGFAQVEDGPLAWADHAGSWRGRPIRLRYTGLDPAARYKVRVVYGGEDVCQEQRIRLTANDGIVVHPYLLKPLPVQPVEFEVPAQATRTGELTLTWEREMPPSGRIRGAQVSEVWLLPVR